MAPPLRHVTPGEKFAPAADTWNAFVDSARVQRGERVINRPGPLIPGSIEFDVYIITQTRTKPLLESEEDVDDPPDPVTESTPIWRDIDADFFDTAADFTLRAKTIKAKLSERDDTTGKWSAIPDINEEDIAIDFLHGVIFTGSTMCVSSVGGVKNWISGYSSVSFYSGSAVEDMTPDTKAMVALGSFGSGRIQATNNRGVDTIFAGEQITLTFSDSSQSFDVNKVACPT